MSGFDIRTLLQAASAVPADAAPRPAPVPIAEGLAEITLRPRYSPVVLAGIVRLAEFALVVASGLLVHRLYLADALPLMPLYAPAAALVGALTVLALQVMGAYQIGAFRGFFLFGLRIVAAWSIVFMLALAVLVFAKAGDTFSRVWLAGWYALGLGALLAERLVVAALVTHMSRSGRFDRRTAIVGGASAGEAVIRALEAQGDSGIRIVGVFDDRHDDRSPDVLAGHPKLGTVDDLVEYTRRTGLDLIIFTLPISAEERILQMLAKLWVLPVDIRLSAHSSKLRLRPRSYSYIGSVPVLDVFDKPIADWDLVLKAVFDRVVGALLLVLLSPVMLAVALAVKLDSPGPVFFRQRRHGFNNEAIEVFKFRSMYAEMTDHAAAKQVTRDDPRVTRVGRIIRKTSLDELPQLFNVVFKGNLSLVGPRPHAVQAKAENLLYDQVVDGYFARHKVKPGITGWAQVNGWRGETDTSEKIQRRVEHDLYYIENWSVFLDIYILAVTPFALLKAENAY